MLALLCQVKIKEGRSLYYVDQAMFDHLQTLDTTRVDWRIRVRVSRMWPTVSKVGMKFIGQNFILLDVQNYHIHAFAYSEDWKNLEGIIIEGNCYEFSHMLTSQATGTQRPVSSNIRITLTTSTVVQPLNNNAHHIPLNKFELMSLQQVYELPDSYLANQTPPNTIDVVGVVEGLQPISIIKTRFGEKVIAQFTLYDGSQRVKASLWDESITQIDPLYEGNLETPTVIIYAGCTAQFHRGIVSLSYTESSRIYINPNDESVHSLRQRLLIEGYNQQLDH